jgi:hypothetical protein
VSAVLETAAGPLFAPAEREGRATLAERLDAVVGELRAEGGAPCPVCEGTLELTPAGGRCRDCGSRIR